MISHKLMKSKVQSDFQPLSRWKKILIHDDKNNVLHEFFLDEKEKLVEPIKRKKVRLKDKMLISGVNIHKNYFSNCDKSIMGYVSTNNMISHQIHSIPENTPPTKNNFEFYNEIIISYQGSDEQKYQVERDEINNEKDFKLFKQQVTVKRSRFIISLKTNDEKGENILLLNKY